MPYRVVGVVVEQVPEAGLGCGGVIMLILCMSCCCWGICAPDKEPSDGNGKQAVLPTPDARSIDSNQSHAVTGQPPVDPVRTADRAGGGDAKREGATSRIRARDEFLRKYNEKIPAGCESLEARGEHRDRLILNCPSAPLRALVSGIQASCEAFRLKGFSEIRLIGSDNSGHIDIGLGCRMRLMSSTVD